LHQLLITYCAQIPQFSVHVAQLAISCLEALLDLCPALVPLFLPCECGQLREPIFWHDDADNFL
jgi:hypothetical protein